MLKTKKRGRPKVGKKRDFRMSQDDWDSFCKWARDRDLVPSQVIRALLRFPLNNKESENK